MSLFNTPKKVVTPLVKPELVATTSSASPSLSPIPDIIAPSSAEVDFRFIRIGNKFYRTLFIVGYPRYVSTGWLEPIIDFENSLDLSMFIYPAFVDDVLSNLKRKIAEMEATLSMEEKEGQIHNTKVEAALADAMALQEEIAKGVERFYQLSFYITLSGDSVAELDETVKQFNSALASLLV